MSLIYITGPTSSGKSTVCQALRDKDFEAYDTDDEGMRKLEMIDGKQLLTLDTTALQKIIANSTNDTIFICGTSPTDLDAKNLFSKIILLLIDEASQKDRIIRRTNSNYGKDPYQLANALKWRPIQIEKYQNAGAEVVDATQSIEEIVNQVLHVAVS